MNINVTCYSGYRGEEKSKYFYINTRQVIVEKILDIGLTPDHRYFKILGDDDSVYIIRHDIKLWIWELTFFQDNKAPD